MKGTRQMLLLIAVLGIAVTACERPTDGVTGSGLQARTTTSKPSIKRINPAGLSTPNGWTHVVVASGGRTIYIAGQTPADKNGSVAKSVREQATQVFENLNTALATAGVGFEDVVQANYYMVDIADVPIMHEVRARYITSDFPASSLVEVKRLARDEFRLEIAAIAVASE